MRGMLWTMGGVIALGFVAVFGQIVANSRMQSHFVEIYGVVAHHLPRHHIPESVEADLRARVLLYESEIERSHLEDGMVVNRKGRLFIDECDSLLFSSLRFIALNKLGYSEKAVSAWKAIEKSSENGRWLRHPQCRNTTSRDMILGVLAAFSQDPPRMRSHLVELLNHLSKTDGYITKGGRFDISYLLPGVAEILRLYARGNRVLDYTLPPSVSLGFSTIEFAAIADNPGYRSHLIGLTSWIELELALNARYAPYSGEVRTAISQLSALASPFTRQELSNQRLTWVTGRLFQNDPENLFFRWLRLRAANAVTPLTRHFMIHQLMRMPQFPLTHLPRDCDRRADYLWQRASWEYHVQKRTCDKTFNGVDFLWMAALLLDPSHDAPVSDDDDESDI